MKKFLLSLLFIAAALCASAQNLEVFVATISDLKTCLKSTSYTKITLLADMPDDVPIDDYPYNSSQRNFIGSKTINLNGHKVYSSGYMMLHTLSTDVLTITGNGEWNAEGAYAFYLGGDEDEAASAGTLVIENGTFNHKGTGYRFFWMGNEQLSNIQVIINGGTFNLDDSGFIYTGSYLSSDPANPHFTLNDCVVIQSNTYNPFFHSEKEGTIKINGGTYYSTTNNTGCFASSNTIFGSDKMVYLGGQAYTKSNLGYNSSDDGDMVYYTLLQVGDVAEDFVNVQTKSSSDGTAGIAVADYNDKNPESGKFLKNTPFKLKAIATPNSGKNFNGWAAVKGTVIEDRSQKEVEFAIGENDIEMKAFFGDNMPTDFFVDNVHYFISGASEVTVGSGAYQSGDGTVPGYKGSLEIPKKVTYNSKDYSVKRIEAYAFYNQSGLTSIETDYSGTDLEYIGDYAFYGCTALSDVDFYYADLTYLGSHAFYGCSNLRTLWIHNSSSYSNAFTYVPEYCFAYCSKLYYIGEAFHEVYSIYEGAFMYCEEDGLDTWYSSPWNSNDKLNSIGANAFEGSKMFKNFTVSSYVNEIGGDAFKGCNLDYIKVLSPTSLTMLSYTSFPSNVDILVTCSDLAVITDPMAYPIWNEANWRLKGYDDTKTIMVSPIATQDNEGYEGMGTVEQVADCAGNVTLTAIPDLGSRFFRWNYNSTYNYSNPLKILHSDELMMYAEFMGKDQLLAQLKYETDNGAAVPADFGGVTFYLSKKGATETAYSGPSVWRKCEKYDEMDIDPSYINLTAKVGNVNDYRYEFVKWKEPNAATASVTIEADRDTVLTAIIRELPKYTCRVSADPAEGGSVTLVYGDNVTEKQEYAGQPVKFYATPATGWAFSHWDNDLAKTDETLEILSLSQDETHVAHFKTQVTLTYGALTPGTGTVTANTGTSGSKYWSGTSVSLTATPIDNYEFVEWSDGNTDNPRTEIVGYADATYTAIFNPIKCTVNVTVVPTGSATVTGAGEYDKGATANLSFIAAEGYEFVSWQREGAAAVTTETYAVPVDAKTINVTLTMKEIVKYTLKLHIESTVDQGLPEAAIFEFCDFVVSDEYDSFVYYESGTPLMEGKYKPETKVHISNYNPFGFVFDHWKDNNSTTFDRDLTMNSDITLTMVVRPVTYSVSAYAQDAKMGTVQVTAPTFVVANIVDEEFVNNWKATYSAEANSGYEFVCWMNQSLYDIIGTGETPYETVDEYVADIKKDYDELAAKTDRDEEEEVYFQLCKFILSPSGEVGLRPMIYGDGTIDIDHATGEIKTMAVFKKSSATDIDNINATIESRKFMENGVLFIQRNGRLYNAQGKLIK